MAQPNKLQELQYESKMQERSAAQNNVFTIRISAVVMALAFFLWAIHFPSLFAWLFTLSEIKDYVEIVVRVILIFSFGAAFAFVWHALKQIKTG